MKIIIFENNLVTAQHLKNILLEHWPIACIYLVHTIDEFKQNLFQNSFDLAILDFNFTEEFAGHNVGKILRMNLKIDIICLASRFDDETIGKISSIRPEGFILKPFTDSQIIALVKQVLWKNKKNPDYWSNDFLSQIEEVQPQVYFFQEFFDKMFMISIFDTEGNVFYANDLLCENTGFSKEDWCSQNSIVWKCLYPNKEELATIVSEIKDRRAWEGKIQFRRKNGYSLTRYDYLFELEGKCNSNKCRYFICFGKDISTQSVVQQDLNEIISRLNSELIENRRQMAILWKESILTGFNSLLIHEMKRPFTGLSLQISLILRDFLEFLPSKFQESIFRVRTTIEGTAKLLTDLSAIFNRTDGNKYQSVSIKEIIDLVIKYNSVLFPYDKISIKTNFQKNDLMVEVFPDVLFVVLFSLVKNACETFDSKQDLKEVFIAVFERELEIVISVGNNKKIGTSELLVDQLFKKFDANTKSSGLGLEIFKSILKSMNGQLVFEKNSLEGSVFEICLPKRKNLASEN